MNPALFTFQPPVGEELGSLLPIAGAIQWMSGLILAFVALGRGRRYQRSRTVPRLFARLAVVAFLLAALDLALRTTSARDFLGQWLPRDFLKDTWQIRILLVLSTVGWLCLLISASWNWLLAVALRRREAAAELKRRMDRALGIHHRGSGPS